MKRRLFLVIFLSLLIAALGQSGYTAAWIEDFSEAQLDSWKKEIEQDKNATWQTKDGLLDIWIDPIPGVIVQDYNLEFIGFPIKAEKLRVKVSVLEKGNGTPGILIGQYDHEFREMNISRRSYTFCTNFIWGPRAFPAQHPNVRFDIKNEIEIIFNKGHFQLLSEGKLILEFDEPNLPFIEAIGIAVYLREVPLVHTVLDDFIISGPSIPSNGKLDVQSSGKTAVLWGRLKR